MGGCCVYGSTPDGRLLERNTKMKNANKEWGGPGDRRRNRTGRRTSLPQGLRTGSLVAARNGPAPVAGFAGPRAIRGALKPDQVTSSASSVVKERLAAVPLAGRPRAAGAPAARGSRSAWPPRRIRDGKHKSNPRARLRSIRCGGGVRRGARPCRATHPLGGRKRKITHGGIEV